VSSTTEGLGLVESGDCFGVYASASHGAFVHGRRASATSRSSVSDHGSRHPARFAVHKGDAHCSPASTRVSPSCIATANSSASTASGLAVSTRASSPVRHRVSSGMAVWSGLAACMARSLALAPRRTADSSTLNCHGECPDERVCCYRGRVRRGVTQVLMQQPPSAEGQHADRRRDAMTSSGCSRS